MVELKGVSSHQKHIWWHSMVNHYGLPSVEKVSELLTLVFYRDECPLQSIRAAKLDYNRCLIRICKRP